MKIHFLLIVVFIVIFTPSFFLAQEKGSGSTDNWNFNIETDFNIADPFYIIPIFQADKSRLHLEARYNYEELETFSIWAGYNITGGKKFQYTIVPMAGGLAGRINGFAPGVEVTFDYSDFELYCESEYIFDSDDSENNFYYHWIDITYSPVEWLFFGVSSQLTSALQTDPDMQNGVLAGGNYKNLDMSLYYFNSNDFNDQFLLLTVSMGF